MALKTRGKVPHVWPRCCGRKPKRMTRPRPSVASTSAARPASLSAPSSQPERKTSSLRPADFYCPGSVLRVEVETSHPLARGLGRQLDAYFVNSAAFEVTDDSRARVVARYSQSKDELLRSGWLLGAQYIAGRAALVEVTLGRGRVVLFGFRPQHRGQTWGTFPFVFNAVSQ